MVLEKDKVYKIRHDVVGYIREYVIVSPIANVDIENLKFAAHLSKGVERYTQFDCHFVVCFDGLIMANGKGCGSSFFETCKILPLEEKDLNDVRKAVTMLGAKYNRKLNKVVI